MKLQAGGPMVERLGKPSPLGQAKIPHNLPYPLDVMHFQRVHCPNSLLLRLPVPGAVMQPLGYNLYNA